MATVEENKQDDVVTIELPAPSGWVKKYTPKKSGTPHRNEIVFVSPTGEEIRNKRQLDRYLKSHSGGPAVSEFDWGTGDTPRRSARLSVKSKAGEETPTSKSPLKRRKKSTPEGAEKKSNADADAEDEAVDEKKSNADAEAEDEAMDEDATTDEKDVAAEGETETDAKAKENAEEVSVLGGEVITEGEAIPEKKPEITEEGEAIPEKKPEITEEGEAIPEKIPDIAEEGEAIPEKTPDIAEEGEAIPEKKPDIAEEGEAIPEKKPDIEMKTEAEVVVSEGTCAVGTQNGAETENLNASVEKSNDANAVVENATLEGKDFSKEKREEVEKTVENDVVLQEPTTGS